MVTSDPAANIEAPIYVAHAFTVHAEETEGDYFTAVDDLKREEDDSGADTIQETELTSGLFYGYVVIDLPGLIENCSRDQELAGRVSCTTLSISSLKCRPAPSAAPPPPSAGPI